MADFSETFWANPEYSQAYLNNAQYFIPDRLRLLKFLSSFFEFRFPDRAAVDLRLCDLGCGDGIMTAALQGVAKQARFTLVDGAEQMLEASRKVLGEGPRFRYRKASFQELIQGDQTLERCDFIYSAFAIHHLDGREKDELFKRIHGALNPGGAFLNIDTVFPTHSFFTDWYYEVWRNWITQNSNELKLNQDFSTVPDSARNNSDNKLTPLEEQLSSMREVGFKEVECHYRNGLFCLYTGNK